MSRKKKEQKMARLRRKRRIVILVLILCIAAIAGISYALYINSYTGIVRSGNNALKNQEYSKAESYFKRISNGRRLIAVLQRHISVRMKMTRQRMYSWTRLIRSQEMRIFMMPVSSFIWIQTRHLRFRNFSMTLMILYRNSCQNMILTDQHTVWMIKRHMMMYSR